MQAVKDWLWSGTPPHGVVLAGMIGYYMASIIEWFIPRVKSVAARSQIEALCNWLKGTIIAKVPAVGTLVRAAATPQSEIVTPHPEGKTP